jgi:hypothetical protein
VANHHQPFYQTRQNPYIWKAIRGTNPESIQKLKIVKTKVIWIREDVEKNARPDTHKQT